MSYISPPAYGLQSLAINEFNHLTEDTDNVRCNYNSTIQYVKEFLALEDLSYYRYWYLQLAMMGLCIVMSILAYAGMKIKSRVRDWDDKNWLDN